MMNFYHLFINQTRHKHSVSSKGKFKKTPNQVKLIYLIELISLNDKTIPVTLDQLITLKFRPQPT